MEPRLRFLVINTDALRILLCIIRWYDMITAQYQKLICVDKNEKGNSFAQKIFTHSVMLQSARKMRSTRSVNAIVPETLPTQRLHPCIAWFYTVGANYLRIDISSSLVTGSIARSAKLPVFNLLRGRFWGFSPRRGETLHRWGWNLARRRGPKVPSCPLLRAKFHPHRCNDKGVGPPKLKFLLRFDRNVEYKRPAGAYPLRDFHKICTVCTSL